MTGFKLIKHIGDDIQCMFTALPAGSDLFLNRSNDGVALMPCCLFEHCHKFIAGGLVNHRLQRLRRGLAAFGVNEYVFTMLVQFFDVTAATDMESLEQIACLQPRPVEPGDIHADFHIRNTDLLFYLSHNAIQPNS